MVKLMVLLVTVRVLAAFFGARVQGGLRRGDQGFDGAASCS